MHTTTRTSDTTAPDVGLTGGALTVAPTPVAPVTTASVASRPVADGSGRTVTAMTVAAPPSPTAVLIDGDPVAAGVRSILTGLERASTVDGELSELTLTLRAIDRLMARAVMLASDLDGHRAAVEEGMHVDLALQLHTDTTLSDIAMVLTAAEVLATMPATALLFGRGVFSWGHIRVLVAGVRRLDAATRAVLDRELDAQADRLAAMEPEARLWALDAAIEQRLSERQLEQREQRMVEREFLALQARFDGSGTAYGEFGPISFAALTAGLDAEADAPQAAPCPGDQDGPGEPVPTRGQQYAAALLRLCTRTATSASGSTGADGSGSTDADDRRSDGTSGDGNGAGGSSGGVGARISVIVDLDRLTNQAAGEITNAIHARPARITQRALEQLSCDAALDLVVSRGTNLLAAQRYAPDITAQVRRAVQVRDGGCRFPGCTAPVAWADVHHVHERARGGDHRPENLVLLCRRHHTTVHQRGWNQTLQPDGTYTLRRRGRTWTTLPRRDQRWHPPDPPPEHVPGGDGPTREQPDHGLTRGLSDHGPSRRAPGADRDPILKPGSDPLPLELTDPLPF